MNKTWATRNTQTQAVKTNAITKNKSIHFGALVPFDSDKIHLAAIVCPSTKFLKTERRVVKSSCIMFVYVSP